MTIWRFLLSDAHYRLGICNMKLAYSQLGGCEPWAYIALNADGFSIAILQRVFE